MLRELADWFPGVFRSSMNPMASTTRLTSMLVRSATAGSSSGWNAMATGARFSPKQSPAPGCTRRAVVSEDATCGLATAELLPRPRAGDDPIPAQKVKPAQLIAEIALAARQEHRGHGSANWDAHNLGHRLTKYLPDVDVYAGSDRKVGRVIVALPGHLGAGPIQIEQREIAICTSPATPAYRVRQRRNQAVLGGQALRAAPTRRGVAPYDRDMVWSVFGMDEVTVLEHGLRTEPITVIFSHVSGGPRLNSKLSLLEVKRQGIWINPVRNRRVAHLARALAENDEKVLAEQYGDVAKRGAEIPEGLVAILVRMPSTRWPWPSSSPTGQFAPGVTFGWRDCPSRSANRFRRGEREGEQIQT